MIYRDFDGLKLSMLGMGAMRLPVENGDDSRVDKAVTAEMVAYAMEHGINYYDTAWGYHSGMSETVMGEVLSAYPRESFYLASKFPGYDLSNMKKVEEIFEKQLEKCRVDYFDFYLFHNVCEMNIDEYLNRDNGIYEYLMKQKKNGRIRHLGFSAHGSVEVMKRFLDAYGDSMEFCQLQLNYIDWNFQNAKAKAELVLNRSIPVWVMEPLRGGKLCALSKEASDRLAEFEKDVSPTQWAFRFLQTLPGVKVILSGMSSPEQLQDNIRIFEQERPLSIQEEKALLDIAAGETGKSTVPCTACHYCVSHCPKQLDIPTLLELYNEHSFTGGGFLAPMALMAIDKDKQPSACVGCRSCEKVCPQQIKISEVMKEFSIKLK